LNLDLKGKGADEQDSENMFHNFYSAIKLKINNKQTAQI
jgi:hypothetical protein